MPSSCSIRTSRGVIQEMIRRSVVILALVHILVLAVGSATGQTSKGGPMAKLTHSLVLLHEQHAAQLRQRSAASFKSDDSLVTLVNDRVVVDAVASGDVNVLKSDLVSLGMQHAVAVGRIVSGQLPISAIPAAAGLTSLRFAQSAAATTHVGSVTSQGDHAMRSGIARSTFGLDGSGINVGALSDSFNCLGGAAGDTASGDLPSVTVIQEISTCTGATDEGRAILQIVHDVAPGASLSFASAFNGQAAFASNILALASAGARVIVDDVLYFAEPMFQDGIIAQTVDSVVAAGVAYFSSAGNQARQSYQSAFRAGDFFADGAFQSIFGAPFFLGGIAHNFNSSGGKKHFQSITIPALTTVIFSLQWDSPFFSVSGFPGTQNDLDIYLLDASLTQVLAGSAFNNVGGDAVELLGVRNSGPAPVTMNLMIIKHSGADPGLIKYVYFGSAIINEFDTQSSTIFGHANAVGAEAVGAARYSNTPAFSVFPPILESFSSSGTTPILFDVAGNRIAAPDPRSQKPEIVAPDGVDTTFFGSDTDGTGFPNFFGTSAAVPHAAGVAALLLQAKPSLTPLQLYQRLENTAIDIGAPGFDNDSGFGLIQTDAALEAHAGHTLYSISRDDDLLRVVNPSTGSTISSVPITLAGRGVSFANGLATHPVTGELFALLKLDGQTGWQLVTINPTTGVATSIGDTGDQFAGLAFNSSGTLFAVVGDKKNSAGGGLPPETLFILNTSNAAPTQVLVLGHGNDGEAIGFNPNDGLIYHASGNDTGGDGCAPFNPSVCVEIFESVNPNNLAVTNIAISGDYAPLTENYSEAAALTHLSGNVLLLADIDQNLYQITTTGVVTFVGSMDHVAKGLAFVNGPVTSLVAAVLPSSRSVQVGTTATAFAALINAGSNTAIACALTLVTSLPATFTYQTTDPATNQVTGSPNTPVNVEAGATQSFVFALTPTAPIAPTDFQFSFDCANSGPAPINTGLNTLLLSASATPVPDIVALAATLTNDGILNIPGANGTGAFAVATVNVGVSGSITASADTGGASLPVIIFICQTNPGTGACLASPSNTVATTINANATPTFAVFVQGSGNVPFDPAANRIFVRFSSGGVTRGSTSVAVRT